MSNIGLPAPATRGDRDDPSAARYAPPTPLLEFLALTFTVTWVLWIAARAIPAADPGLRALLFLPGTFTPAVVALWLTARTDGPEGTQALLRRLMDWRVDARWYLFALGYLAAVKLTAALVYRLGTGAWPPFGQASWYLLLAAVAMSTVFQAGEEIGWRGYALPGLASRLGLAPASILLGIIWASWHLPLFFIPGHDEGPFPVFLLYVTALSVAMAWLYAHTRGSLLLAMLMHSAFNNTNNIVPAVVPSGTGALVPGISVVTWITILLLWVGAGYFLVRLHRASRRH